MRILARNDRGAAAIEYAIIGALIGIGLVGSLVGTKGSLSAIFGVAASQMGSATPSAQAGNPQAAFWAGKTLAAPPSRLSASSPVQTRWVYTDGTTVDLQTGVGGVFDSRAVITDPVNKTRTYYYADMNGSQTLFEQDFLSSDMSRTTLALGSNTNQSPLPGVAPVVANMTTYTYSASGTLTSTVKSAASSDFVVADQAGYYNWAYFVDAASAVK